LLVDDLLNELRGMDWGGQHSAAQHRMAPHLHRLPPPPRRRRSCLAGSCASRGALPAAPAPPHTPPQGFPWSAPAAGRHPTLGTGAACGSAPTRAAGLRQRWRGWVAATQGMGGCVCLCVYVRGWRRLGVQCPAIARKSRVPEPQDKQLPAVAVQALCRRPPSLRSSSHLLMPPWSSPAAAPGNNTLGSWPPNATSTGGGCRADAGLEDRKLQAARRHGRRRRRRRRQRSNRRRMCTGSRSGSPPLSRARLFRGDS
jgi:hypothetical protein